MGCLHLLYKEQVKKKYFRKKEAVGDSTAFLFIGLLSC